MDKCNFLTVMLGVVLQSTRASAVDCGYSVGGPSNNDCPRMVEDDRFFMCLSQNMNCQDRDVYHCAKNESGIWTEVCAPQTMCEKGNEPLITRQGNVVCRFCVDSEMYNPFSTLSNKFSYCPKKKTKCSPVKDGKKIIECESSGHPYDQYTRDRKCRCNYEEDYIPYFYNMETYNWTCSSFPKELSCYQSRCPRSEDGREQKRGQGYRCHPVSPVVDIISTPKDRSDSTEQVPDVQNYTLVSTKRTQRPAVNTTVSVKTRPSSDAPETGTQKQSSDSREINVAVMAVMVAVVVMVLIMIAVTVYRTIGTVPRVTNITHKYTKVVGDLIQPKGKHIIVNPGQNVRDTTADETPSTTPQRQRTTWKQSRKQQRPVSQHSGFSEVEVPHAASEDPFITPHVSTDNLSPVNCDRRHNSLDKRSVAGHSRQPSGSRSCVDTPLLHDRSSDEQYGRSASDAKLNTSKGILPRFLSNLLKKKTPLSPNYTFSQKDLLETSPNLKDKTNGEEGYKRVLNRLIEDLKQNMDPVAVLDGLVKHGLGTENKRMDIKDEVYTSKKNDMILDVIKFSGFKGYKKFKRTLLDTNHKDLLEKIKTEENKILSQGEDDSDAVSEPDRRDDSDDDTDTALNPDADLSAHNPGASPDPDLTQHHCDTNNTDIDTSTDKAGGEHNQTVNKHSDRDENGDTGTRSGVGDKTPNGKCRKRSDESLSKQELKAKQHLLKMEKQLSWDKLKKKATEYKAEFLDKELEIPESTATCVHSRVYTEGEQSLPPVYLAYVSSPNGNCLYNSVSLLLYGDEGAAYRLRLAAVCNGAINSKLYVKEHIVDRSDAGSMMQFMHSRLTQESLSQLDQSKIGDLDYLAEFTIQMAVRETIKPGSYSSPLQVLFLSTAIGYTIHQYFQSGIPNLYEVAPTEHQEILPLSVSERGGHGCIRILWVAMNSNMLNHIVPVIEKISVEPHQVPDSVSPVIHTCRICREGDSHDRHGVLCDQCGDWFHTECVRQDRDQLDCVKEWYCPGCLTVESDVVVERSPSPIQESEILKNAVSERWCADSSLSMCDDNNDCELEPCDSSFNVGL